ncbi:MAG: extracellular solute-binding protein [Acetobacteraceae bacterium]|jgi:multiple sugar transport system substrate-binding protein
MQTVGKARGWALLTIAVAVCCIAIGPVRASAEQIIVKMWMHEHPPRIAIDKSIIAAFEQANPDVKVQYEVIPVAEYGTKLLTAFASGAGPDLFNQFSGLVAQYYNARVIAPIDFAAMGFSDEAALTGQYLNGFDGARFAGRLYGVPTEVSNWACYANNKIWKEAGLDPGHDFPATWEALPAIAEKLTQRDANGVPLRRGFDFNWSNRNAVWLTSSTMLHQLGGNIVDEASYKATMDTPAGRRVMQYWADWANKLRLGGPQYTDSRTDFLAGRLATECSFGIWGVPQMKDARIDYTVKPAPRFSDAVSDNGFDAYAYYMMVNARSSAATQKAAWKLARAYTDHAADLFTGAGLFVPRKEVMALPAYKADPTSAVFIDELKKAKFSPRVVGYDQVADTLLRGRDRMVQGSEPVATVLPEVNDEMNAVLRRERARAEAMAK